MELKEQLDNELNRELEHLGKMSIGTDEMAKAVETVETLHKLRMEELKREDSVNSKNQEFDLEKRKSRNLLIASLAATTATFCMGIYKTDALRWLMNLTADFEKTGNFVSKTSAELLKGTFSMMFKDR